MHYSYKENLIKSLTLMLVKIVVKWIDNKQFGSYISDIPDIGIWWVVLSPSVLTHCRVTNNIQSAERDILGRNADVS